MKCYFNKFSIFYAMSNKKVFFVIKCFECYVLHVEIFDIVQNDNGKEFKRAVLMLLKNHGIKVINERPRIFRTQKLVKQANEVMKDKIRKKIEATENFRWTQHLARIVLCMNTQKHDNFSYNMTSYEVFFGRNYSHRLNNFVIMAKQQTVNKKRFIDDVMNKFCAQEALNPAIESVFNNYLEQKSKNETHDENENEKKRKKKEMSNQISKFNFACVS